MSKDDERFLSTLSIAQDVIGFVIPGILIGVFFIAILSVCFVDTMTVAEKMKLVCNAGREVSKFVGLAWIGHLAFEFMISSYKNQIKIKKKLNISDD